MALTKVSTDGVKDDAITKSKIPANQIEASEIATGAVTEAKIQAFSVTETKIGDQAVTLAKLPHGTSSNDGKFLRANNGADPTFESLPSSGLSNIVEDTSPQLGGLLGTEGFNIAFGDGSTSNGALNRLTMGASNDLQIFHNGTNSIIENATGALVVKPEGLMRIQDRTTDEVRADFVDNGEVSLYYNNIKKIETTSTGIKITGETEAGGGATSGNIQMVNGGRKNTIGNHFSTNSTDSRIEIGISDGSTSGGTNRVASFSYAGLAFGHDTASANRLDDYEEGSWTPSMSSGTATFTGATYVKVGKLVYVSVYANGFSDSTSGSIIQINGLPYTAASNQRAVGAMLLAYITTLNQSIAYIGGNSSNIRLYHYASGGDYTSLNYEAIDYSNNSARRIFIGMTYLAA